MNAGSFGVLTLNADGSYSYDGNPNVVPPAGAVDTFVYTITDGDGDTSTVTLTINLTNAGLAASNDDLTVNENALDATALPGGSDPCESRTETGSLPGSAAETDATNQLTATGGAGPITYALVTGRDAATRGHASAPSRSMPTAATVYALTSPVDRADRRQRRRPRRTHAESFTYRGDRRRRQHRPPARSPSTSPTTSRRRRPTRNSVDRGRRCVTGNVLTDGADDVFGADGATITFRRAAWPGRCGGRQHLGAGDRRASGAGIAGTATAR